MQPYYPPPEPQKPRRGPLLIIGALILGFGLLAVLLVAGVAGFVARQRAARGDVASLERQVLPGSAGDATADVVDHDYQFQIRWPGKGWKMLGRSDARQLVASASAGIVSDECFGVVIVEPMPRSDLPALAASMSERMELEGKQTISARSLTVADEAAHHYVVTGTTEGMLFRFDNTLLFHDEHLYQLFSWAKASHPAAGCVDVLRASFSLLDGPVRGRVDTERSVDQVGVGWRLRQGVYESSVHELRVEPEAGWRALVGQELRDVDTDAVVGLVSAPTPVRIIVRVQRARGVDAAKYTASLVEAAATSLATSVPEASVIHEIGDRKVPFKELRGGAQPPMYYHVAAFFVGDSCYQVQAWYSEGHRAQALQALPAGLRSIRLLTADRAEEVGRELEAGGDPQVLVGPEYAMRRGVYTDFAGGFSWTKPAGAWTVAAGERARVLHPSATLHLAELRAGLNALVVVDDPAGRSLDATQQVLFAKLTGQAEADAKLEPSAAVDPPATLRRAADIWDGQNTWRYELASVAHRDRHVHQVFWGFGRNVAESSDAIAGAIRGIALHPEKLPMTERDGSRYRDLRLGFSFAVPGSGWALDPSAGASPGPLATMVTWVSGPRRLMVIAYHVETENEEWFLGFMEQVMAQKMGDSSKRVPQRSVATLGVRPARRLSWSTLLQQAEALLMSRGKTFYAILAIAPAMQAIDLAQVQAGFALLE